MCELGLHGIRVNCLVPHGVPLEIEELTHKQPAKKKDDEAQELKITSLLRGISGTAKDVAYPAVFLASDMSQGS